MEGFERLQLQPSKNRLLVTDQRCIICVLKLHRKSTKVCKTAKYQLQYSTRINSMFINFLLVISRGPMNSDHSYTVLIATSVP